MVTGEYWIFEDGSVTACDGDVGDTNHEVYAMDHACSLLDLPTPCDPHEVPEIMAERLAGNNPEAREQSRMDPYDFCLNRITDPDAQELFTVACGHGDARLFATQKWGWSALRGNHIETWNITDPKLEVISRGIENVFDEEGYDIEEADPSKVFYITSYVGRRSLSLTLKDIESRNFSPTKPPKEVVGKNAAVTQLDKQAVPSFYQGLLGDSAKAFCQLFESSAPYHTPRPPKRSHCCPDS